MFTTSILKKGLLPALVVGIMLFNLGIFKDELKAGERNTLGILVQFYEAYSATDATYLLSQVNLKILTYLPQIDVWLVTSGETAGENETLAMLRQQPAVAWAEKNGTVQIQEVIPNDNFYQAQQQNLRVIGLPAAWTVTTGDDNPIAVIDTGLDLDHPDLQDKVWRNLLEIPANDIDDDLNGYIDDVVGWDFVNQDNVPQDDHSHGSHVAGIAAAQTNNSLGVAGVSWGARLMALKALNGAGDGTWADVAEALLYAADNGAKVINMSFGDEESSETIELAVAYATAQGCLLVAAAGNGGSAVLYPAALPDVVAVSATNNQDLPWSNSNRGAEVDIAAPGVDIFSTNASGSYTILSGTSMATPHVSGVASLIWSKTPEYTSIEVTHVLTTTAIDVWSPGHDPLTGWGRVSASQAIPPELDDMAYFPLMLHLPTAGKQAIRDLD